MCIALQKERTDVNIKEEKLAQNFKIFRTVCLATDSIFSNIACVHTIVFIMFKQNFVNI